MRAIGLSMLRRMPSEWRILSPLPRCLRPAYSGRARRDNGKLDPAQMLRAGVDAIGGAVVIGGVVAMARAMAVSVERLHVEANAMTLVDQRGGRNDFDLHRHHLAIGQRSIVGFPV